MAIADLPDIGFWRKGHEILAKYVRCLISSNNYVILMLLHGKMRKYLTITRAIGVKWRSCKACNNKWMRKRFHKITRTKAFASVWVSTLKRAEMVDCLRTNNHLSFEFKKPTKFGSMYRTRNCAMICCLLVIIDYRGLSLNNTGLMISISLWWQPLKTPHFKICLYPRQDFLKTG